MKSHKLRVLLSTYGDGASLEQLREKALRRGGPAGRGGVSRGRSSRLRGCRREGALRKRVAARTPRGWGGEVDGLRVVPPWRAEHAARRVCAAQESEEVETRVAGNEACCRDARRSTLCHGRRILYGDRVHDGAMAVRNPQDRVGDLRSDGSEPEDGTVV